MKRFIIFTLCITFILSTFSFQASMLQSSKISMDTPIETEIIEIPDIIEPSIAKEKGHIKRIKEEEDDLKTLKFLNQNGTISVYKFCEDVKYIDNNGTVQDKTNKLSQKNNYYVNESNDINCYFPCDLNDSIKISYKNLSIKVTPQTTSRTNIESKVSNNSVSFDGAFGANTSVIYTPTFSGYTEDIILDKYTGTTKFSYIFETGECVLENYSDIIKIYHDDKEIGVLGNILVFDQTGQYTDGYYRLEELPSTNKSKMYKVTVCVNADYLRSNATNYPVIIEPTIRIDYTNTEGYILDATLYSGTSASYPALLNFNDVGYRDSTYGYGRTITRFPGLMADDTFLLIPADIITSVKYYTYCIGYTSLASIFAYQYDGTANWINTTTSFINTYTNNIEVNSVRTINAANTFFSFDITKLAKSWKITPALSNYGILLKNTNESNANQKIRFASAEANNAYKPYIVFDYVYNTTYNIKSYYSQKYSNNVSNASSIIANASEFTQAIYDQFNVTLNYSTNNIVQRTSRIDACTHASRVACNNTCGTDCYESHHRNYKAYGLDLYNISRSDNDIVVGWDFVHSSTICYESASGTHTLKKAMGLVPGMNELHALDSTIPTTASRGILIQYFPEFSQSYWDGAPVIAIFESCVNMDITKAQSTAKLVLAHEMAHVMGIYDVDYNVYEDHNYDTDCWPCIMKAFGDSDLCDEFISKIENEQISGFCTDCHDLLSCIINSRYFLGN